MKAFGAFSTGLEVGSQARRFSVKDVGDEEVITASTSLLVGYSF